MALLAWRDNVSSDELLPRFSTPGGYDARQLLLQAFRNSTGRVSVLKISVSSLTHSIKACPAVGTALSKQRWKTKPSCCSIVARSVN